MQMFCHNRRLTDHHVSGIPALDPSFMGWPFIPHTHLPAVTLQFIIIVMIIIIIDR